MDRKELLNRVDHTLLAPDATQAQIFSLCEEGMTYGVASVCIPASRVREARSYVGDRLAICTVIGFPTGCETTAMKCFAASDAVRNGADEIDMVINIGWLKDGRDNEVEQEIRAVKAACGGKLLKVIIETCLLTEEEKIRMCGIVSRSGAEFIKTSTGFSKGGATGEDIALLASHIAPHVRIKAAGGIASLEDAEALLRLGASRLGTSRIVKLIDAERKKGV